jgi:hypothetical protein
LFGHEHPFKPHIGHCAPNEDFETKRLITVAADNLGRMGHSIDEELGGFVATERVVGLAGPMDKDDISARKKSGRDPRGKTRDVPENSISFYYLKSSTI